MDNKDRQIVVLARENRKLRAFISQTLKFMKELGGERVSEVDLEPNWAAMEMCKKPRN